jgi:hypothetical protein
MHAQAAQAAQGSNQGKKDMFQLFIKLNAFMSGTKLVLEFFL